MTPTSVRVAIGLGSNQGDRIANLRFGLSGLRRHLEAVRASSVYETVPRYMPRQPLFLNACCVGRTRLTAQTLLEEMKSLESEAGRIAGGPRYGPRILDLDLLLYGKAVIEQPGLVVPHPRMHERGFVLIPLAELAPDLEVPTSGESTAAAVAELAERVDPEGVKRTNLGWESQP